MKKLIVIVIAVAAIFGLTSCGSSSPSSVVKDYMKALKAQNYEKAISYTVIDDPELAKMYVAKMNGFDLKILDYKILSEEIDEGGNTAGVEVQFTRTTSEDPEPETTTDVLELTKVDGKWKINV